jgi:hypothetical protein
MNIGIFPGCKARPACKADRQFGILDISQPYRPPRSVTEIALLFFSVVFIVCNVSFIACMALCGLFETGRLTVCRNINFTFT